MMSQQEYEAKRQARYERLLAASARAQRKGEASLNAGQAMFDVIPFGQPILVGHHSEGRDRRYRERARNKISKGYALYQKAQTLKQRAEAAQNNRAIFSDDPSATEQIADKIKRLEARQALMVAANKAIRKGDDDALRALGFSDDSIHSLKNPRFSYMGQGFPRYELSNNNANIRRLKQRLVSVEREQSTPSSEETIAGVTISDDADAMRVAIYFPGKPDEKVRDELKRFGFRWAPTVGAWQRQRNGNARYWARDIVLRHYAPDQHKAEQDKQRAAWAENKAREDAELLAEEANRG